MNSPSPHPRRVFAWLACAVLALVFAGCQTVPHYRYDDPRLQAHLAAHRGMDEPGFNFWDDPTRGHGGRLEVEIDLSNQTAYFYRGAMMIGRCRVATGKMGYATPTGSFTIIEKELEKRSTLYGRILDRYGNVVVEEADSRKHTVPPGGSYVGARMPFWMRLTSGGIGMHAGPIPHPGRPASHGCIRMPREIASILYAEASVGTPVRIVR